MNNKSEKIKEENREQRKITTVIISATLAAFLVAGLVFGIVMLVRGRGVNYLEDDLSEYITLSEADYKGYTLEVAYDEMREWDIDRKIMSYRYSNRKSALYNGGNIINLNLPIDAGDTVKIYYRGYMVEDGREVDIAGACNFSGNAHTLGVGSLGFIPGFEDGLVGKKPGDYPKLNLKKSGTVSSGDIIYLSYKALMPDGTSATKTMERIDLASPDLEQRYGKGFKDIFEGCEIGKRISESKTLQLGTGSAVYFEMTVNFALEKAENPLTVNTYFPSDYGETALRGKEVTFEVYFEEVIAYDTPEYNEDFILNTLKISEQTLSDFDGKDLVEKHRNMIKSEIEAEYANTKKALVEEAIWLYLNEAVEIKKLPKREVKKIYEEYYGEIKSAYDNYYSSTYPTLDGFATAYLGLSSGASWTEYIEERARAVVTEKIIFYYIIREEELVPKDEEYTKLYESAVREYLDYYLAEIYGDELAAIKEEDKKAARIAEIKAEMIEYYGEEYFSEMAYYQYSYDRFIALPSVVKK